MAKKRLTVNQSQYQKEYNRLLKAIDRINKTNDEQISKNIIPPLPNRVSKKSIETLKSIKPKDLSYISKFSDKVSIFDLPKSLSKYVPPQNLPRQSHLLLEDERESEYKKQLRRAYTLQRQLSKRGYEIDVKDVLSFSTDLYSVNPKELYERATFLDTETGELMSAKQHLHDVRVEAGKKAWQTRLNKLLPPVQEPTPKPEPVVQPSTDFPSFDEIIVSRFRNQLMTIENYTEGAKIISNWFDSAVAKYGDEVMSNVLQRASEDGVVLTFEIAYSSEKAQAYIYSMLNYLEELNMISESEVMDIMYELETMEDYDSIE